IRNQVMPALAQAFPQIAQTVARSSANAAQAAELLDDLAQIDLQATGAPPRIRALQALSGARLANALRYWLRSAHGQSPTAAQLAQLVHQLRQCTTRGHQIHIKVGRGYIQRHRDVIDWYNPPVLV
ncbi:MAG: TilS substrate-binding domain-containing protein, partial [Comamonas sp.]